MGSFGDVNFGGGGINPNKMIEKNAWCTKTIGREIES